jgi:uncharacterized membrane protein YdjX (TVP38/TMEM64 family)
MPAPERHLSTAKRRAALAGLLTLGLVMVVSFVQLHEWVVGFLPAIESIIRGRPILGGTAFVLFAAVSAMLAFVSSAVIVPVGVYTWGKFVTMLLLMAGWVLGGVCGYVIGRYLGRPAVNALASAETLARYESRISRLAPFGLVLLFQMALPSEVPAYLLGIVRYRFWKYLCALVLAELPYSVATVYLGEGFVERRPWLMVGVGGLLAAFSVLALYMLNRRFRLPADGRRETETPRY